MTGIRLFAGIVIAMVAATAAGGLYLGGSPSKVRNARFDETRVNDLQQISSALDAYYDATGGLPASTAELMTGGKVPYYVNSINDPETMTPYEYRATGGAGYELCATFSLPTQPNQPGVYSVPAPVRGPDGTVSVDWTHPAGRHCYEIDASMSLPREACGITNPCTASDATCATLPGKRGTYCVPKGQECLAAGCPGECAVTGSYPVTVSCTNEAPAMPAPPPADGPASSCSLVQEKKTGRVACVPCTDHACAGPAAGWQIYERPAGASGVPYSCYLDRGTCALAQ